MIGKGCSQEVYKLESTNTPIDEITITEPLASNFMSMPVELRSKVWEYSIDDGVECFTMHYTNEEWRVIVRNKRRHTLSARSVSRESREAFFDRYKLVTVKTWWWTRDVNPRSDVGRFYVDLKGDTLCFGSSFGNICGRTDSSDELLGRYLLDSGLWMMQRLTVCCMQVRLAAQYRSLKVLSLLREMWFWVSPIGGDVKFLERVDALKRSVDREMVSEREVESMALEIIWRQEEEWHMERQGLSGVEGANRGLDFRMKLTGPSEVWC